VVDTIRLAGVKVPYYRDLFTRISFNPEQLARDPKYLQDLPYLTKDIIRAEGERMLRDDHAQFKTFISKTGGSTGPSTHIAYDQSGADWSSCVTRYARNLIGVGPLQLQLHLAARFQDAFPLKDRLREQVKCLANNRINVTFASYAPEELDDVWRRIVAARPYLVHGHPSTLYQMALHVAEHGLPRGAFKVFESSGEMLDARQRQAIEHTLECVVVDRYGLAEAGVLAYQIDPSRSALLYFDPIAWPEVMAADGTDARATADGRRGGELVVTTVTNRMMPLIRYRTGDLVTLRETTDGFWIDRIWGRIHDIVDIAGVRTPTHHIQDVLDRIGGIREFQIEVAASRPVFRIVPETTASTDMIRQQLHAVWGAAIDVAFVAPDQLRWQGWRAKFRHIVPAPVVASDGP
jgi:phenylacetate-CoA ligase